MLALAHHLRSGLALSAVLLIAGGTAARAQLGGFQCPMTGKPNIRQGDAVAKEGGRFNSARGEGHIHGALDLNGVIGQLVLAALSGRAAVAQLSWGAMGNTVIIDHGAGAYTVYGHLNDLAVKEGDNVKTGQKIGSVGYSGKGAFGDSYVPQVTPL